MKLKLSYFFKSAMLLSALIMAFIMKPDICFAAQSGSGQDTVISLEKDKVYEYDLNGDGKLDKIQYKVTANDEEFTAALKLYINDKLCLKKYGHGFTYIVELCDLNTNDNYLDLYLYEKMESDCIGEATFAKYNGDKIVDCVGFDPVRIEKNFVSSRYYLTSVSGDGKFMATLDTPIFSYVIGCYYCNVPFQIKDNKISRVQTNIFSFTKYSKEYKFKAIKGFSAYIKAGSKTVACTVKKGDTVTFDKLYISKSGIAYFRLINSKGKTGWIKSDRGNLFKEYPAWG